MSQTAHPPWCDREQCGEPRRQDRFHHTARKVPVLQRRRSAGATSVTSTAETAELNLVLFTSASGPDETWVSLDVGEWSSTIAVTVKSMRRVHAALGELLRAAAS